MNLIDMDRLRKELMAKGDIPIHEVFNTIWEQPIVNISQPCEDCISREEAINELKLGYFNKDLQEGKNDPCVIDAMVDWAIRAVKRQPSVTPKARWIPCSERLPERDENVLTYHRNESFDYQYVSWIDDYSGKWAGFIGNLSDEVLAWSPLPEDYKEEDE
jgi:hypothetical protein